MKTQLLNHTIEINGLLTKNQSQQMGSSEVKKILRRITRAMLNASPKIAVVTPRQRG
nr:MAG TPA: hypothetical protein [Caudoviricetes sp.]